MNELDLITVGFCKGEIDFGVRCTVSELTLKEMNQLRIMMCVAIHEAESMWAREQAKKYPAYQEAK